MERGLEMEGGGMGVTARDFCGFTRSHRQSGGEGQNLPSPLSVQM